MVFTFDHCWHNGIRQKDYKQVVKQIKPNVKALKKTLESWHQVFEGQGWRALYWLNHDHPRLVSQYGNEKEYWRESAIALCNTLYLMPGTIFIYNGEEIGMTNLDYQSVDDFADVWVTNMKDKVLQEISEQQFIAYLRRTSRVNARTPMQWSSEEYAGFSVVEPAIKLNGNYRSINVATQLQQKDSILNHYRWLLKQRKGTWLDVILDGSFTWLDNDDCDVLAYRRVWQDKTLVVISSFSNKICSFDFELAEYKVVADNYRKLDWDRGVISLQPWQSVILENG
jgi:glycosidase